MTIVEEKTTLRNGGTLSAPRRTSFSDAPEVVVTENYNSGLMPENAELGAEEDVPPAYSEFHDQFSLHQAGFDAGAAVTGMMMSFSTPLRSCILYLVSCI